jgi:hypothetical protein
MSEPDAMPVDRRYYEAVGSVKLAERLMVRARRTMYGDMLEAVKPGPQSTILDIGVSDVLGEGANFFEQMYPHQSRITAVGLGAAPEFRAEFPDITYRQIHPGASLPFEDNAFDVAISNAVLEHVGDEANQRAFVAEAVRVAKTVFITVPHRFFPVEHHTGLPLAHWSDRSFRLACRVTGKSEWAHTDQLRLMSSTRLRRTVPPHVTGKVRWTGLRLGPFSSNLSLHIDAANG